MTIAGNSIARVPCVDNIGDPDQIDAIFLKLVQLFSQQRPEPEVIRMDMRVTLHAVRGRKMAVEDHQQLIQNGAEQMAAVVLEMREFVVDRSHQFKGAGKGLDRHPHPRRKGVLMEILKSIQEKIIGKKLA